MGSCVCRELLYKKRCQISQAVMLAKNGKAHTYALEGPLLSSRDLHIQVVQTGRPGADIDKKDPAPDLCFIVPG